MGPRVAAHVKNEADHGKSLAIGMNTEEAGIRPDKTAGIHHGVKVDACHVTTTGGETGVDQEMSVPAHHREKDRVHKEEEAGPDVQESHSRVQKEKEQRMQPQKGRNLKVEAKDVETRLFRFAFLARKGKVC